MEQFSLSIFAAQLNTVFTVSAPGVAEQAEMLLVKATDRGTTAAIEQFSLVFQAQRAQLPQGTYSFRHQVLGEIELFIVPIKKDDTGFLYEAAFSRLLTTQSASI